MLKTSTCVGNAARFTGQRWQITTLLIVMTAVCFQQTASGQEATPAATPPAATEAKPDAAVPPLKEGHSIHGEIFNEGPRQAAYLM